MIRFSTDDIPPEDRFDQWREVRGKSLFGVTIELPPDRRHTFKGSFRAQAVGGADSRYRPHRRPQPVHLPSGEGPRDA